MPDRSLQAEEKIREIALQCELDRLRLRIALLPAPSHEATIAGLPASVISKALSYSQYIPGMIGKVSRGVYLGTSIFRVLKPLGILRSKFRKLENLGDDENKRSDTRH